MKIWIDTDIGSDVDDALTLGYALRHPEVELVGVSTVFGDVALRTRITRALLDLADRADVPVLTGLGKPLCATRKGVMFGHEGRGLLDDAEPVMRVDADPDARATTDALARAIERTAPDALVAIGPMTNLGALARAGFALPRLAIMGGKVEDVEIEGAIAGIEEWNWFSDPVAVQAVLAQAGDPLLRVLPAEVTFGTHLEAEDVARLAGGDALARALARLSEIWLAFIAGARPKPPCVHLHDPLTLASLFEPGLCAFADRRIEIDGAGATRRVEGLANAEVATDVDNDALRAHLMETWLG